MANRASETSDAIERAEVGTIARARLTLDAIRGMRRGGTCGDVQKEMVHLGLADFHVRTVYRHLHALQLLGLVKGTLVHPTGGYRWRATWPTPEDPDPE